MSGMCERVERARVAGEALGEDEARHAAGCDACRQSAALVARLERAMAARKQGLPDAGFVARVGAGAQRRIARRSQRVFAVGSAVAVACAVVLWIAVREQRSTSPSTATSTATPTKTSTDAASEADPDSEALSDDEMFDLVALSDLDLALRPAVHWEQVIEPIEEYRALAPEAAVEPRRRMP